MDVKACIKPKKIDVKLRFPSLLAVILTIVTHDIQESVRVRSLDPVIFYEIHSRVTNIIIFNNCQQV